MPNYEDFKKKAKDAIDTLADISVEAYKAAEEKARILARRTKLSAEITRDKALIRRLKAEIGNKYYDLHKDDPEEALKQDCEEITSALDRIAVRKDEIEELKNSSASECCCDEDACCDETVEAEVEPAPEAETAEAAEAEATVIEPEVAEDEPEA